jgi:DNA-binding LacI/PurR family transcriptional regulator
MARQTNPTKKPRASIRQVAELAGVSPMTVSNVLRKRDKQMGEATRLRVLDAIRKLNYIPVRISAQNRHVSTNSIGLVFLQVMLGPVGYPTFRGMCERAQQHDYDLTILLRSHPDDEELAVERQFLDRRCDGYIFIGQNNPQISQVLVDNNIPVVECYSVNPVKGVVPVIGDSYMAMELAVKYLVQLGHTKIAHLGGTDFPETDQRCEGYQIGMKKAFGSVNKHWIVRAKGWGDRYGLYESLEWGPEQRGDILIPASEEILKLGVTAVVCASDPIALGLRRVSIIGVDNMPEAELYHLTTIGQPFETIGRMAVDAILQQLKGIENPQTGYVLPVKLIVRASTASPSQSIFR